MGEKQFNVFSSNRLELLVEALSRILKRKSSDPFTPETVVVQSRGMARYISLETARYNGVSANMDFIFPNVFIEKYLRKFDIERGKRVKEKTSYSTENLTWVIFQNLPGFLGSHSFEEITSYISGISSHLKRYQLAVRIADLFDQYLLFRPDMIINWEKGEGDDWQSHLWRYIRKMTNDVHRVDLFTSFMGNVKNGMTETEFFPERIMIFGISALPPFYMDVFNEISAYSPIHLFLLNPCGEYWGDILSEKERTKSVKRMKTFDGKELHLNRGNRLLASLGKTGREFFDFIQKYDYQDIPIFQGGEENSLLSYLKDDILFLRDPSDRDYVKRNVDNSDLSIQVHSCHSPLREIEVLNDRLYGMFEEDASLQPRDVLVMMTDSDTYAPLVHAVFGKKPDGRDPIPYSVADRSFGSDSRVARIFLDLIGLKKGRFTVSEVMGFLEEEEVRGRYGIDDDAFSILSKWIREAGIHWGWDKEQRVKENLPAFSEGSWMTGIRRLLLGYALPVQDIHLYDGTLPCDFAEGKQAEFFGSFLDFLNNLRKWSEELDTPKSPEEWAGHLLKGLESFVLFNDETARDIDDIKKEISAFSELGLNVGITEKIDYSVICSHFGGKFDEKERGGGFITGGVTFCAMLPMRSIPFKVICILGMNSGNYPRIGRSPGFDLIAKNPRPGDRSRRNDDRYLFLEALISSRKIFYISYTGRNVKDNTAVQPSVLVSELFDYIDAGFDCGKNSASSRLTLEHPLQPFSPLYFVKTRGDISKSGEGLGLFSYSKDNYNAVARGFIIKDNPPGFFKDGMTLEMPKNQTVDAGDFFQFFRNPSQYILERQIGIRIAVWEKRDEDSEPFDIKGLDRYLFMDRLTENMVEKRNGNELYLWARSTGILPVGRKGEIVFRRLKNQAEMLTGAIEKVKDGKGRTSVEVDATVNNLRIRGTVGDIYGNRMIRYRPSPIGGKDIIGLWLRHVLLKASMVSKEIKPSLLFGIEKSKEEEATVGYAFDSIHDPLEILSELSSLYIEGMKRPLRFFPLSSHTFMESLSKGKNVDQAMETAIKTWQGSEFSGPGEGEDPYHRICYRYVNPFDHEFERISRIFFEPVYRHMVKIEEGGIY